MSALWQLPFCFLAGRGRENFLFERTRLRTTVWFADGNVVKGYRHNIKSLFAEWLRKQCANQKLLTVNEVQTSWL